VVIFISVEGVTALSTKRGWVTPFDVLDGDGPMVLDDAKGKQTRNKEKEHT